MISNKIFLIKALDEPKVGLEDKMIEEFCDCFEPGDELNYVVEDVAGLDYIFLRFPDYKIKKVCSVLDRYIKYDISEITTDLILGDNGDLSDIIKSDEFKDFFNNFRIENTNVDDILDKINEMGIDALDDIDREILVRG